MSTATPAPRLSAWVLLLAGPVIWFAHFMGVYLLVEAACAVEATEREVLGLHVLSLTTLAATAVAVAVTLVSSGLAYLRWRRGARETEWLDVTDSNAGLAFAGFVLGILSIVAICFVGVPAAVLEPC